MLPAAAPAQADDLMSLTQFPDAATTFTSPVELVFTPADPSRAFVVQRSGVVRVIKDGALLPDPFVDLSSLVESTPQHQASDGTTVYSENGMASIAFAPDYASSGTLYAFFTSSDPASCATGTIQCDDHLVKLQRAAGDADHAGLAPDAPRLIVPHRVSAIHHGGQLSFGPDGNLWLATGEAGHRENAQDISSPSGKVLRLDPAGSAGQYDVMAWGLRNPFRYSWDGTRLLLGDVGENHQEEIDSIQPSQSAPPNGGWPRCEGSGNVDGTGGCDPSGLFFYDPPLLTYDHTGPCTSVTGGHIVRDAALPGLWGRYLYSDYCHRKIWSARVDGGPVDVRDTGLSVITPVDFAQDSECRTYVVSLSGPIYRLDAGAGGTSHACADSISGPPPGPAGDSTSQGPPAIPGPPVPARPAALRLTALSLSRTRVRAGLGVTLHLSLSATATVSVRLYRALPGHRRGPRCVAGAGRRHCVRYSNVIDRARRLGPGRKAIALPRALGPGTYRLTVRASDAKGDSASSDALALRVLPPPR
jgi:glucose/arabinose dehydrogenase